MNHDKLRELAQAATPGEWESRERFGVTVVPGVIAASHVRYPVKDRYTNGHEGETRHDLTSLFVGTDEDAEFIAAANPAVVLALLDELRDAKAQALRDEADRIDAMEKSTGTERVRAHMRSISLRLRADGLELS